MDKKCHGNSTEISVFFRNRSKLGHRTKLIYNEIVNIHGDYALSYRTVFR